MTTSAVDPVEIHGVVADGFEPVRTAFARNFADHGEVGAACAVILDGDTVVDLWAGSADRHRQRPWERDTLVNVYSTTKGVTALSAHVLADRGLLDLDAPVAEYWPEFAHAGKGTLPVRWLLTHQAGLPVVDAALPPLAALDWEVMVGALEAQAPVWEPGAGHGYHAVTFGWLVGEVVRRAAGADSFSDALHRLVTGPLGVDFHVGLPDAEHHRVADLVRGDTAAALAGILDAPPPAGASPDAPPTADQAEREALRRQLLAMADPSSLAFRSLGLATKPHAPSNNDPRWRRAQLPAANGHATARAIARVYAALAAGGSLDGVGLLSPDAVRRAAAEQVSGPDAVLAVPVRRSLGFMLPVPGPAEHRGPASFGHAGAGGSLGYADPERGIGFAYVMNRMWGPSLTDPDPRAQALVEAVHRSLDQR